MMASHEGNNLLNISAILGTGEKHLYEIFGVKLFVPKVHQEQFVFMG